VILRHFLFSLLNDFIIKNDVNFIEEEKILDPGENFLIISAEPGMGKSLILDKLIISCFVLISPKSIYFILPFELNNIF
jgi:hypothetical protein